MAEKHDAGPPQHEPLAAKKRDWGGIVFFLPVAIDGRHFYVSNDPYFSAE